VRRADLCDDEKSTDIYRDNQPTPCLPSLVHFKSLATCESGLCIILLNENAKSITFFWAWVDSQELVDSDIHSMDDLANTCSSHLEIGPVVADKYCETRKAWQMNKKKLRAERVPQQSKSN
jgi:hypothetical protein